MDTQEKKRLIKAVNQLGRKATAADAATKSGLPVLATAVGLNQIAYECGGHLQVSTAGDIVYKFDLGFQNAYLARGIQRFLQNLAEQAFRLGFFLLRISFGLMLILSLLIIVLLFVAVIISMNRGNDRDSDQGSGFNFDFFDYMILRDLFIWDPYSYQTSAQYGQSTIAATRSRPKGNFLYNCFSFLFGDGNPNCGLEERRWQMVAQMIRANGGVVTAEQFAPYTDADPANEDGVLPALVRFDGRPEVTESGNIVYSFPSLQVSVTGANQSKPLPYIRERRWLFSNLSADELMPVGLLAAVNLIGSWWLYMHATRIAMLLSLKPLLIVLIVYGSLFVFFPLIRWLVLNLLNAHIDTRNAQREKWVKQITSPSADLSKKLAEAQQFKTQFKPISDKDIIYSTDKDLLDQKVEI